MKCGNCGVEVTAQTLVKVNDRIVCSKAECIKKAKEGTFTPLHSAIIKPFKTR